MKTAIGIIAVALTVWLTIVVVNHFSPPPSHAYSSDRETRYCHDHGCRHYLVRRPDSTPSALRQLAEQAYRHNIQWLGQVPGLDYRQANIVLYVVLWPLLMALLTYMAMARLARRPIWSRQLLLFVLILLSAPALALFAYLRWPAQAGVLLDRFYWYCTDFTINLANLLGLSYAEINGLLFLILFPLYTLLTLAVVLWPGQAAPSASDKSPLPGSGSGHADLMDPDREN